jgi:hypothetical protein
MIKWYSTTFASVAFIYADCYKIVHLCQKKRKLSLIMKIPFLSTFRNFQLERQRQRIIAMHDPTNPKNEPWLTAQSNCMLNVFSTSPPIPITPEQQQLLSTQHYPLALHELVGHTLVGSLVLPQPIQTNVTISPNSSISNILYSLPSEQNPIAPTSMAIREILHKVAGYAIDTVVTPQNEKKHQHSAVRDFFDCWWIASKAELPLKNLQPLTNELDIAIANKIATGTSGDWVSLSKKVLSEPIIGQLVAGTRRILGTIPNKALSALHQDLGSADTFVGDSFISQKLEAHLGKRTLTRLKTKFEHLIQSAEKRLITADKEALRNWKVARTVATHTVNTTPAFIKLLARFSKS